MDTEGFVPINVIASFRRVKNMTHDMNLILTAVQQSALLQVKSEPFITYVRPIDNPTKWVISALAKNPGSVSPGRNGSGDGPKRGSVTGGDGLSLNPDVPEFVPKVLMNGSASGGSGKESPLTAQTGKGGKRFGLGNQISKFDYIHSHSLHRCG
jgi:hypothetical protein